MDIFEITGYRTGISDAGVNFLQPSDSFQEMVDGFIYRQVLQSRRGISKFAQRLKNDDIAETSSRIFGIFEHIKPDGTKDLLAIDANRLYKYNDTSGIFDLIPFGGSMAAYTTFNNQPNDAYVSGVSYPTKTNTQRFIFTGSGLTANAAGSAVFFYDGTNVLDYTSLVDNPDYAPPLNPTTNVAGTLVRAKYVFWFNSRLNFVVPTIDSTSFKQGVLYSAIQDAGGDGDKFNVPLAGFFSVDSYEDIKGAIIRGEQLILDLDRSNWVIERTTDQFDPYYLRRIPSVLGTDASFSSVAWNEIVASVGRTGVIEKDGRTSVRTDNKIPYFTADEIDQVDFNLTYGGFDRVNNQFLWAYKQSETDTDTQNRVLNHNYEEDTWSVYNLRFSVFGQTDKGLNLAWNQIEGPAETPWARWDTTEERWDRIGLGKSVQKTLAGDDLGFIYQLNQDWDDYFVNITAATNANPCVLTIDASAFQDGDLVVVQSATGMEDAEGNIRINNFDPANNEATFQPYTLSAVTPTSATIDFDSTDFTAYGGSGTLSKVISFSAKTIPFNPYREIGRRCFVSHIEVLLQSQFSTAEVPLGFLRVDVFQDGEDSPYKADVLLQPTEGQKGREWITMTVDNEANFHTFVFKHQSPAVGVKIYSVRIHAQPGGLTSG